MHISFYIYVIGYVVCSTLEKSYCISAYVAAGKFLHSSAQPTVGEHIYIYILYTHKYIYIIYMHKSIYIYIYIYILNDLLNNSTLRQVKKNASNSKIKIYQESLSRGEIYIGKKRKG